MNKFAMSTFALALGTMSFSALADRDNDNRYNEDNYYNNQNYNQNHNQNYNQNYNNQNYSQNYNNGNVGFIQNGRYYNYDQYNVYNQGRYVNAKVVRVVPITQRVSMSRGVVCQQNAYPRYENQNYGSYQSKPVINAGSVTGAVIGGVIGNQVAGYPNKAAGTVVGATIGGLVGNAIAQNNNNYYNNGQNYYGNGQTSNCYAAPGRYAVQTVGYYVTYRYAGNNYLVHMPYYPERHLRIRLDRVNQYAPRVAVRY